MLLLFALFSCITDEIALEIGAEGLLLASRTLYLTSN